MGNENDAPKPSLANSLPLVSRTTTPRLTPPGSPPTLSASTTPKTTSRPLSPRRHFVSFATTRGMFDDTRSSISISEPGSHAGKFKTRLFRVEVLKQLQEELVLTEKSRADPEPVSLAGEVDPARLRRRMVFGWVILDRDRWVSRWRRRGGPLDSAGLPGGWVSSAPAMEKKDRSFFIFFFFFRFL